LNLYLVRHGSSSTRAGGDDHERSLTPKGERDARGLGVHLTRRGARPEIALCSSARRAVETLDGILVELPALPERLVVRELYLAAAEQLLDEICSVDDAVNELMVVGHNPGVGMLAARLAGAGEATLRERLERGFPAGGLAELGFDGDGWRASRPGAGTLHAFYTPDDAA